MASESMVEDQSDGSNSNTAKSSHPNKQFTSVDDYAPKARKPYTITKQRERWTEEEHKKFLEALKLYGRAWRRIEEHVGTKTAVQIRSHAQKFFSKVVKESNGGDGAEVKPIEIPPPRPKRKPTRPYPRKLSAPLKTGGHRAMCTSPNSSGSDQENQSPTSVLSAGGSNTFALGDSSSPNADISSDNGVKPAASNAPEENDSSSPMKVESCSEDKGFSKESSTEAASTQSLKLFGKTLLVTDSVRPSSSNNANALEMQPQNYIPVHGLPCGAPVYYMQFLDENSDSTMWSLYGGLTYPFVQLNNPNIAGDQGRSSSIGTNEKEVQNEGSLTGSSEEWGKKPFQVRASERSAFTELQCRGNSKQEKGASVKGFVPYKRCVAERNSGSSVVTGEEREEQRIRLCL